MRKNILIEFSPKITYKEWVFYEGNGRINDFFSENQLIDYLEEILEKIPSKLLDSYEKNGWKIIITNQRNIEEDYNFEYEVYGCTDYEQKTTIVYANKNGIDSLLHELAHYLDSLIEISKTIEWENIYKKEQIFYKSEDLKDYFTATDSQFECFADAFLVYILNKDLLKRKSERTYKIINNLFIYFDYII